MAENLEVKVDVQTKDALRKLGKVDKGAEKTGKSFLKMGKAVGVAAGAFAALAVGRKVVGFLAESTKLALAQEEAERKLAVSLGRTSQELLSYAQALQKVTVFGDEEILNAQSLVANFIKEEAQIKALTPAILDLATAKGMTLANAADLVTKTVASSTNALSRYGIVVEGEAGSTERIASAVDALTASFGGLAEGMAQTNQGQLKQMENEIGDLREEVGEKLLPAFVDVKRVTLDFYNFILNNEGTITKSIKGITSVISDAILVYDQWLNKDKPTFVGDMTEEIEFHSKKIRESKKWIDDYSRAIANLKRGMGQSPAAIKATEDAIDRLNQKIINEEKNIERGNKRIIQANTARKQFVEASETVTRTLVNETTALTHNTGEIKKNEVAMEGLYQTAQQFILPSGGGGEGGILAQAILGTEQSRQDAIQNAQQQLGQTAISSAMSIANSISQIKANQARAEISALNKQMRAEIDGRKMSARARVGIEKKFAKEREKIEKESAERQRRLQVAQAVVGLASGIAKIWSVNAVNPILAGIQTGLITASTVAQLAAMKSQAFADGGVVQQEAGVPSFGDNHIVRVNPGEEILTANDPRHRDNNGRGGGDVNITIQGNVTQDVLAELEGHLRDLESNNRINLS